MNKILFESGITAVTACILGLMLIPVLGKFSQSLGLVDKPNHRKVHFKPTPVIGGIAIMLAVFMALFLSKSSIQLIVQYPVVIGASILMFVIGVWDDRKNLRPSYRLTLQLLSASAVALSGIRITSLYGFLGIEEIHVFWQYFLTILIIAGVANAFNLMDGIDGLAGGLAFINLLLLAAICYFLKLYPVFILLATLSGAIIAFLKNNIHPARIFMGDGGSLMLGFLFPVVGILLIETSKKTGLVDVNNVILIVCTTLVIPVFDSLRVYSGRIRRGDSPFKADKTHLHHLFLIFGLNHKRTAFIIYGLELAILSIGILLNSLAGFSLTIMAIVAFFLLICQFLQLNSGVEKWLTVIRKMEEDQ